MDTSTSTTAPPDALQPLSAGPLIAPDMTADQAREVRAQQMADAGFRTRAINVASREWQQLQALDRRIAGISDEPAQEQTDPRAPTFAPPDGEYEFMAPEGHAIDPAAAKPWTDAFRSAGVDADMAAVLVQLADHALTRELDVVQLGREHDNAHRHLRGLWGDKFDEHLQAADAEGKRMFDALPAGLKDGMDYRTFVLAHGLGNSVMLTRLLFERAAARTSGGS